MSYRKFGSYNSVEFKNELGMFAVKLWAFKWIELAAKFVKYKWEMTDAGDDMAI